MINFVHYRDKNKLYTYRDKYNMTHNIKVPVHKNGISVIFDYRHAHTSKLNNFFLKNKECFKPYKFLLDKTRMPIRP